MGGEYTQSVLELLRSLEECVIVKVEITNLLRSVHILIDVAKTDDEFEVKDFLQLSFNLVESFSIRTGSEHWLSELSDWGVNEFSNVRVNELEQGYDVKFLWEGGNREIAIGCREITFSYRKGASSVSYPRLDTGC